MRNKDTYIADSSMRYEDTCLAESSMRNEDTYIADMRYEDTYTADISMRYEDTYVAQSTLSNIFRHTPTPEGPAIRQVDSRIRQHKSAYVAYGSIRQHTLQALRPSDSWSTNTKYAAHVDQ